MKLVPLPENHQEITTESIHRSFPQTAVILAGGLGTRLRNTVPDKPKVMAPVAGRPFLDYVLSYLAKQGIKRVILSIGYMAEQVRAFVDTGSRWGIHPTYCQEVEPLGTGGALRLASEQVHDPAFFALNGDTLFQVNLPSLWQAHKNFQVDFTLALHSIPSEEWSQHGCVILAKDGRILSFNEKPDLKEDVSVRSNASQRDSNRVDFSNNVILVNGGVYMVQKSALGSIPLGEKCSLERQIFPHLVQHGRIAGILTKGYFADIGTPHRLAAFEDDVKRGVVASL